MLSIANFEMSSKDVNEEAQISKLFRFFGIKEITH